MLGRQAPLVGYIDKQMLIAATWRVIHLPPASLSANNCKNATEMDLGTAGRGGAGTWTRRTLRGSVEDNGPRRLAHWLKRRTFCYQMELQHPKNVIYVAALA